MRAILLDDTTNWYHHGCFLTSAGLKSIISKKYKLVDSVSIHELFPLVLEENQNDLFSATSIDKFVRQNESFLERFQQCDVVIVNGEGSVHGFNFFVARLFTLLYVVKNIIGKQVFMVNHSAYPDDAEMLQNSKNVSIYRTMYKNFDYVAVRETYSKNLLTELGIPCELSFDCAVLSVSKKGYQKQKKIVFGSSPAYTKSSLIPYLKFAEKMSAAGWQCKYIYGATNRPAGDDIRFISDIEKIPNSLTVKEINEPDTFVRELESASYLISGRFHYSIIAFALGTPFFTLSANTPKNAALCDMLLCDKPVFWDDPKLYEKIDDRFQYMNIKNSIVFVENEQRMWRQLKLLARQITGSRWHPFGKEERFLGHLRALAKKNIP